MIFLTDVLLPEYFDTYEQLKQYLARARRAAEAQVVAAYEAGVARRAAADAAPAAANAGRGELLLVDEVVQQFTHMYLLDPATCLYSLLDQKGGRRVVGGVKVLQDDSGIDSQSQRNV